MASWECSYPHLLLIADTSLLWPATVAIEPSTILDVHITIAAVIPSCTLSDSCHHTHSSPIMYYVINLCPPTNIVLGYWSAMFVSCHWRGIRSILDHNKNLLFVAISCDAVSRLWLFLCMVLKWSLMSQTKNLYVASVRHRACQAIVPHGTTAIINISAANKNQIAQRLPNLNECSANELK